MNFEDWLTPRLPRLLRLATVLCGGSDLGQDLVQDVAIKAQARWSTLKDLEHPEAYLRRMIVNEHLSWRRRWSRIIPQDELRDSIPGSAPDFTDQHADRAELVQELNKLPRRQKAVLVLRYFEGLDDGAISAILGCSAGTVRSHASRALTTLRVEMSASPSSSHARTTPTGFEEGSHAQQQLIDALESLAAAAPTSEKVLTRLHEQGAPRPTVRRRRLILVLAAVLAVAFAITVPRLFGNHTVQPADARAPGNWNLIHRVDLPAGWGVALATVTADKESTQVTTPNGQRNPAASCYVTVWARGAFTPDTGTMKRRPVDVNGHSGFYAAASKDLSTVAGVSWTYTDDGWANVDCGTTQQADLEMASRVVFEPTPILLPFRLRSLPEGYQVTAVQSAAVAGSQASSTNATVRLTSIEKNSARPTVSITVYPGTAESKPGLPGYEQTTIGGLPAVLSASDRTLCLNDQGNEICIEAPGGQPADLNVSLWPAGRRELLMEVAESLQLAKNLADTSEWTDASKAVTP